MKRALVPVLILLVAFAASLPRTSPAPESPDRKVGPAQVPTLKVSEPSVVRIGREVQTPAVEALLPVPAVRTGGAPVKRTIFEPSWSRMRPLLERELGLTPLQQQELVQALAEREQEIQACHDSIRKAGIIDLQAYEWQAVHMKEGWYRRIDAMLDVTQHERFVVLVEKGLLNEGLAFTVEPGMTVLE